LVAVLVAPVPFRSRPLVVDSLNVRFRAWRAPDVSRPPSPRGEPVEALLAHARRQYGHAAAAEDPGDGDASATIIAGRGPHRALAGGIEAPRDEARRQAGLGGEHPWRRGQRERGPPPAD